ncbi:MAG: hypothetical protein LBK94_09605, partial [Prevotellaceae bacterium]|nr:hypothetical protein [Prevotellaceae bacterium]
MDKITQEIDVKNLKGSPVSQIVNIGVNEGNPFNTLKKGNYAPVYSLKDVVDRVGFLSDIDSALKEELLPVYLHSIGGVGKTTIAQAYCNSTEYAQKYDYIFWVDASNEDVRKDVLNYDIFSFKEDSENPDNEFARFVRQSRELSGNVLLVIDNVQQIEQIQSIEKDCSLSLLRWNVLVTSRESINDNTFKKRVGEVSDCKRHFCVF